MPALEGPRTDPWQAPGQINNIADLLAQELLAVPITAGEMAWRVCRFAGWDGEHIANTITRMQLTWSRISGVNITSVKPW